MTEMLTTAILISFIIFAMLFAFLGGFAAPGLYELANVALMSTLLALPCALLLVASTSFMPGAYRLDKMKPKDNDGLGALHAKAASKHKIEHEGDFQQSKPVIFRSRQPQSTTSAAPLPAQESVARMRRK